MSRELKVDLNEIVNFNFNKFNLEDKQQLTAKITALSLFLLDKKGKYQIPENTRLYFDDESNCDACYMRKHIYLGSKALVENRQNQMSNYATHIENTAHEVCHLGQDADNSLSRTVIYDYSHFIHLLYHPIFAEMQKSGDYQTLDNLIFAFYRLQPHELEAQKFSLEVFEYIINNCDKSKVDKNKLERLIKIVESTKSEFYEDTEMYIESINSVDNRRQFVLLAQEYKKLLFEQIPMFLEEIKTFKVQRYILNDNDIFNEFLSTIYALVNALEVDYDDKLANDLFDAIAESSLPPDKKQTILYNIVAYTNFIPSPEQEKLLTIRCLMTNNFMGTREDLYASKQKTMAIINNLFDKELLQIPTR